MTRTPRRGSPAGARCSVGADELARRPRPKSGHPKGSADGPANGLSGSSGMRVIGAHHGPSQSREPMTRGRWVQASVPDEARRITAAPRAASTVTAVATTLSGDRIPLPEAQHVHRGRGPDHDRPDHRHDPRVGHRVPGPQGERDDGEHDPRPQPDCRQADRPPPTRRLRPHHRTPGTGCPWISDTARSSLAWIRPAGRTLGERPCRRPALRAFLEAASSLRRPKPNCPTTAVAHRASGLASDHHGSAPRGRSASSQPLN